MLFSAQVLYKMDKFGNGMQILYSDLVKTKELCFTNFTQQMVLEMCIFSGCDYLASLPGMGVKRAHALVKRFKNFRKVRRRYAQLCQRIRPWTVKT